MQDNPLVSHQPVLRIYPRWHHDVLSTEHQLESVAWDWGAPIMTIWYTSSQNVWVGLFIHIYHGHTHTHTYRYTYRGTHTHSYTYQGLFITHTHTRVSSSLSQLLRWYGSIAIRLASTRGVTPRICVKEKRDKKEVRGSYEEKTELRSSYDE